MAYENIKLFVSNKKKDHDLFDLISAGTLNDYLRGLMEGLSAKVFRTYYFNHFQFFGAFSPFYFSD